MQPTAHAVRTSPESAISDGLVRLLATTVGRGPVSARTTLTPDLVTCVMGAALTKGEQVLVVDGQGEQVLRNRRAYQRVIEERATAIVEEATGRRVLAFLSCNHIDPDLAVQVFVLVPDGHRPKAVTRVIPSSPSPDGDAGTAGPR